MYIYIRVTISTTLATAEDATVTGALPEIRIETPPLPPLQVLYRVYI